MKMCKI